MKTTTSPESSGNIPIRSTQYWPAIQPVFKPNI